MESLRRLRIVWVVLCGIGLALTCLAWYGGTPERTIAILAAGLAIMAGAAAMRTPISVLSFVWIGGLVTWVGAVIDKASKNDISTAVVLGLGGYIAVAAVMWVIGPMLKRRARP